MNMDDKYDTHLVSEDYYGDELKYQKDIDKLKTAETLETNISYERIDKGLLIKFPENFNYKEITGNMFLYRPSNKQLDFETSISLSNSNLLIPDNRLVDGRWNIKIDWQYKGKYYLFKEYINY
tara:strand:+ start:59 stop:427 length:369 start_codon:yes stop_codon:yes gene_type:complete